MRSIMRSVTPVSLWSDIQAAPAAPAAAAIAVVGLFALGGAWFFEFAIGLPPCPLCLEQRVAYYVAIPLAAMIMLAISVGASRKVIMLAFIAIAGFMLWNGYLGIYHAGIEWRWWEGPQDCSGAAVGFGPAAGLMERIQASTLVRCDEAPWRFLGLSLAGYNALISFALAAIAGAGATATWRAIRIERTEEAAE